MSAVQPELRGPALWTGGPFGPEAGLLTTAAGAALLLVVYRRRPTGDDPPPHQVREGV